MVTNYIVVFCRGIGSGSGSNSVSKNQGLYRRPAHGRGPWRRLIDPRKAPPRAVCEFPSEFVSPPCWMYLTATSPKSPEILSHSMNKALFLFALSLSRSAARASRASD
jgi:hypothetical protein